MTELYIPEYPPILESEEGRRMAEYVYRQLSTIRDEFDTQADINKALSAAIFGHGGLITRVATTIPNIAAGSWETIPFDTGQVTNPIQVTQEPTNNRFSVDAEDVWFFTFYIVFLCDKQNKDRIINWRIYNETTGVPYSADPFPIPVENGAHFGQSSASTLVEVSGAIVGDWLRIELGGSAQAFSGIELEKAGIALIRAPGGQVGAVLAKFM